MALGPRPPQVPPASPGADEYDEDFEEYDKDDFEDDEDGDPSRTAPALPAEGQPLELPSEDYVVVQSPTIPPAAATDPGDIEEEAEEKDEPLSAPSVHLPAVSQPQAPSAPQVPSIPPISSASSRRASQEGAQLAENRRQAAASAAAGDAETDLLDEESDGAGEADLAPMDSPHWPARGPGHAAAAQDKPAPTAPRRLVMSEHRRDPAQLRRRGDALRAQGLVLKEEDFVALHVEPAAGLVAVQASLRSSAATAAGPVRSVRCGTRDGAKAGEAQTEAIDVKHVSTTTDLDDPAGSGHDAGRRADLAPSAAVDPRRLGRFVLRASQRMHQALRARARGARVGDEAGAMLPSAAAAAAAAATPAMATLAASSITVPPPPLALGGASVAKLGAVRGVGALPPAVMVAYTLTSALGAAGVDEAALVALAKRSPIIGRNPASLGLVCLSDWSTVLDIPAAEAGAAAGPDFHLVTYGGALTAVVAVDTQDALAVLAATADGAIQVFDLAEPDSLHVSVAAGPRRKGANVVLRVPSFATDAYDAGKGAGEPVAISCLAVTGADRDGGHASGSAAGPVVVAALDEKGVITIWTLATHRQSQKVPGAQRSSETGGRAGEERGASDGPPARPGELSGPGPSQGLRRVQDADDAAERSMRFGSSVKLVLTAVLGTQGPRGAPAVFSGPLEVPQSCTFLADDAKTLVIPGGPGGGHAVKRARFGRPAPPHAFVPPSGSGMGMGMGEGGDAAVTCISMCPQSPLLLLVGREDGARPALRPPRRPANFSRTPCAAGSLSVYHTAAELPVVSIPPSESLSPVRTAHWAPHQAGLIWVLAAANRIVALDIVDNIHVRAALHRPSACVRPLLTPPARQTFACDVTVDGSALVTDMLISSTALAGGGAQALILGLDDGHTQVHLLKGRFATRRAASDGAWTRCLERLEFRVH